MLARTLTTQLLTLTLAALVAAVAGCAASRQVDLLEAALREQEQRVRELQEELRRKETQLQTARRQTELLRRRLHEQGCPILPEQLALLTRLERVRIERLFSGGLDLDSEPGDDALLLVLVPLDHDGDPVKVAGRLRVRAFEPDGPQSDGETVLAAFESQSVDSARANGSAHPDAASGSNGDPRPPADETRSTESPSNSSPSGRLLGQWQFSPEQVRESWTHGLVGSGYQFELPLAHPPRTTQVRVEVELETVDGRLFRDTARLTVTPSPQTGDRPTEAHTDASGRPPNPPSDDSR